MGFLTGLLLLPLAPLRGTIWIAEKLTEVEPANRIHVEGIKGDLSGQRQAIGKLHQQGNAAAAKLAYFLGLGPGVDLVPVDARLVPLAIVDATPPASDLVAQALANGPGVRELEALLSVVESGIEKTQDRKSTRLNSSH